MSGAKRHTRIGFSGQWGSGKGMYAVFSDETVTIKDIDRIRSGQYLERNIDKGIILAL
jgi:hypothetical protein